MQPRMMPPPEGAPLRPSKGTGGVRDGVLIIGSIMIVLVWAFPIWSGVHLLWDGNFVFWIGRTMPLMMILAVFFLLALWYLSVMFFFKVSHVQDRTDQTIFMIGCIFVTLMGLSLVLMGLVFTGKVQDMHDTLWYHCGMTADTLLLSSHYEALKKLRERPDCLSRQSVRECAGYVAANPYTGFLESAEQDFRCSGFCLPGSDTTLLQPVPEPTVPPASIASTPPQTALRAVDASPIAAPAATAPAYASEAQDDFDRDFVTDDQETNATALLLRARRRNWVTPIALTQMDNAMKAFAGTPTVAYPPTLFSNANFPVSCQGMMARNLKFIAAEIGHRTFIEGVFLLLIAIAAGFLMTIGFCASSKPQEFQGLRGIPEGIEGSNYGAQDGGFSPTVGPVPREFMA